MFIFGHDHIVRLFKNTILSSPLPPATKKAVNQFISLGMKMGRLSSDLVQETDGQVSPKENEKVDVWTSFLRPSSVGLQNLGNTCYANCVLQALFVTKRFSETVMQYDASHMNQPVLYALKALFQLMKNLENHVVSASNVLKLTNPKRGQQDSSEYLMTLFEMLHKEDTKRQILVQDSNIGEGSSKSSEVTKNKENLLRRETRSSSSTLILPDAMTIIQSIFGGKIQIDIQCLQCGTVSSRTEFFTELPVFLPEENKDSINQPLEMEELLHSFFSSEKLTDNNRYECQKCQTLQDGIRIQQLASPPQYLILILNRFKFNQSTKELQKHMRKVHYSAYLELPVASDSPNSMKYMLYAAIVHVGSNMGSGHYYTLIKKENDQWWRMDDETVSKSTMEKLNQLNAPETPYILFYHASSDLVQSSPSSGDNSTKTHTPPPAPEKRAMHSKVNERKDFFHKRLNKKGNSAYKKSLNYVVKFVKDMHKR